MSEPRQYTKKEKIQNWLYYNIWWVIVVCIVIYVVGGMVWTALGIGQVEPDYHFSYLGTLRLPDDCVEALEAGLATLGQDLNGDGQVVVELVQHVTGDTENAQDAMYGYAASVTFLADITEGTSYYFLVNDPQWAMDKYQMFANPDGSVPEDDDFSIEGKVFAWSDCPVLTALDLGEYEDAYLGEVTRGQCQELLSGLYLGRRYFYDESTVEYLEEYDAFWQLLTGGAQ